MTGFAFGAFQTLKWWAESNATARYVCCLMRFISVTYVVLRQVNTIAFHAATGTLAVAILKRGVAIYRCDPGELVLPPKADSMFDRRVRRPLAESDLAVVKEHIATFDASVYAACDKERGLLADIERLTEQRTHHVIICPFAHACHSGCCPKGPCVAAHG